MRPYMAEGHWWRNWQKNGLPFWWGGVGCGVCHRY